MPVNKEQKAILYVACTLVVLSTLFPPVTFLNQTHVTAFSPIFDLNGKFVVWGFLMTIQTGIALLIAGLFVAFQN